MSNYGSTPPPPPFGAYQPSGHGTAPTAAPLATWIQRVGAWLICTAFVRDLCHFFDGLICDIGFLFPLWDEKRQTLADKIVSTLVTA